MHLSWSTDRLESHISWLSAFNIDEAISSSVYSQLQCHSEAVLHSPSASADKLVYYDKNNSMTSSLSTVIQLVCCGCHKNPFTPMHRCCKLWHLEYLPRSVRDPYVCVLCLWIPTSIHRDLQPNYASDFMFHVCCA